MRNHYFLVGVLLLMDGLFVALTVEVKPVLVMKGDSVTLNSGVIDTQRAEEIRWWFGDSIIAKIKNGIITYEGDDERFRGRLKLDDQTGSLTITNIKTEHDGLYQQEIEGENFMEFHVTVYDVVESVSVTEGDTVTLHTGVTTIQRGDVIKWFGDQGVLIADLNGPVDARRSDIQLNHETGEITIRNIRDQSGDYKVEINTSNMILHRKFRITFNGIFEADGMKPLSVMTGESVILHTRITDIPRDDVIEWTFGPQKTFIVKTDREKAILLYNEDEKRFTNKLHLNIQTGDLTISNPNTEVSGFYQLKIIKSTYTLEKGFNVTVIDPRSGAVSGISGASVVLMVWAVTVVLLQEV